MATNEILPLCPTATGTNLEAQATYAIDSQRSNGNQPGVASSKLNNKALRQGTYIASQVAQYVSNQTNSDVLDDADPATLLGLMNQAWADNSSTAIENLSLAVSVASSQMTVAVKTAAGNDASAASVIYVSLPSATLTSGKYSTLALTAAQSLVIPSGATLGQSNTVQGSVWVYEINNGGSLQLAVSGSYFTAGNLITTTAISSSALSASVMYSSTAVANAPYRLIGKIINTQPVAGIWSAAPSQVILAPIPTVQAPTSQIFLSGSGTYTPTSPSILYIELEMVGGGGGAGAGAGAGAGGTGGNTTFGTIIATGGAGGSGAAGGSLGGVASGVPSTGAFTISGGTGGVGGSSGATMPDTGGPGGSSPFGGAGNTSNISAAVANAKPNSGSGGGGQYVSGTGLNAGSGGGAGAYVKAFISPAVSVSYAVGAAGSSGGGANGTGGSGIIIIREYYQ